MPPRTLLTPEGLKKIKVELVYLKTKKRGEIAERIRVAKEHGDLSENAEYHMAREEQGFVEGRILELDTILKTADVASMDRTQEITVGSTIYLKGGDGKVLCYHMVGATEADPANMKISFESPLGRELLGKKKNDHISIVTPNGTTLTYQIEKVN